MSGWIKLHRDVMKSTTFRTLTSTQKLIAIYIILNANHEDGMWADQYKGIQVPVKRGQLITSRNKIAESWFKNDKDITEQKVRTALVKLKKLDFLTIETTSSYTLINVVNYCIYQAKEKETNQEDNQVLTKHQPSANQVLTTNKNDKNVKNDKKNNLLLHVGESPDPFSFYQNEIGNLSDTIKERLQDWIDEQYFDEPEAIVLAAMEEAVVHEKRSLAYVETVLRRCFAEGIKTVAEYEQKKAEFEANKTKVTPNGKKGSTRVTKLPSSVQQQIDQHSGPPVSNEEQEAKQELTRQLLKALGED